MTMSLLERRLNQAFSGGIMFVQPTAETYQIFPITSVSFIMLKKFEIRLTNHYWLLACVRIYFYL